MADQRIPKLIDNWVGKNFISIEPMLGEIDLNKIKADPYSPLHFSAIQSHYDDAFYTSDKLIDWVVCGCENGPRDTKIEWIRKLRDQLTSAEVPFLLKQLKIEGQLVHNPEIDGRQWLEFPETHEVIL
jgi:hypothetical protein